MYRSMAFMPQLKLYLRGMGTIYTVRKYRMAEATVRVEGVGICKRTPIGQVTSMEELEPYVKESGFFTLDGWWDKINTFIPDGESKYLYKVEVLEKESKKGFLKKGVWIS